MLGVLLGLSVCTIQVKRVCVRILQNKTNGATHTAESKLHFVTSGQTL